jgi:hypothetical protein
MLIILFVCIILFLRLIPIIIGLTMTEKGELTVSGADSIEIILNKKYKKFNVHFVDNENTNTCIPCNPGTCDELVAKFIKKDRHHYLLIIWEVSSIRDIKWRVFN